MRNEWLEDFRLDLYTLGRAVWDYQDGIAGAVLDLWHELYRVAKQVVREFTVDTLSFQEKEDLVRGCVNHMSMCGSRITPHGLVELFEGTSLMDELDLSKEDPFNYCVKHMTEYLRMQ